MSSMSMFKDFSFVQNFQNQIFSNSWKCDFNAGDILDSIPSESKLYQLKGFNKWHHRRSSVVLWMDRKESWSRVLVGAYCEAGSGHKSNPSTRVLQSLGVLDAFQDFIQHLECFYKISKTMTEQGEVVQPISQHDSRVHDIDKLDPVMLVGYSERFTDNVSTSLWQLCVDRHIEVNPHHQGHPIWQDLSTSTIDKKLALSEMVCDKVSRRLQKDLSYVVCEDMWNVEGVFFKGLPDTWLEKAERIISLMKHKTRNFY